MVILWGWVFLVSEVPLYLCLRSTERVGAYMAAVLGVMQVSLFSNIIRRVLGFPLLVNRTTE